MCRVGSRGGLRYWLKLADIHRFTYTHTHRNTAKGIREIAAGFFLFVCPSCQYILQIVSRMVIVSSSIVRSFIRSFVFLLCVN